MVCAAAKHTQGAVHAPLGIQRLYTYVHKRARVTVSLSVICQDLHELHQGLLDESRRT